MVGSTTITINVRAFPAKLWRTFRARATERGQGLREALGKAIRPYLEKEDPLVTDRIFTSSLIVAVAALMIVSSCSDEDTPIPLAPQEAAPPPRGEPAAKPVALDFDLSITWVENPHTGAEGWYRPSSTAGLPSHFAHPTRDDHPGIVMRNRSGDHRFKIFSTLAKTALIGRINGTTYRFAKTGGPRLYMATDPGSIIPDEPDPPPAQTSSPDTATTTTTTTTSLDTTSATSDTTATTASSDTAGIGVLRIAVAEAGDSTTFEASSQEEATQTSLQDDGGGGEEDTKVVEVTDDSHVDAPHDDHHVDAPHGFSGFPNCNECYSSGESVGTECGTPSCRTFDSCAPNPRFGFWTKCKDEPRGDTYAPIGGDGPLAEYEAPLYHDEARTIPVVRAHEPCDPGEEPAVGSYMHYLANKSSYECRRDANMPEMFMPFINGQPATGTGFTCFSRDYQMEGCSYGCVNECRNRFDYNSHGTWSGDWLFNTCGQKVTWRSVRQVDTNLGNDWAHVLPSHNYACQPCYHSSWSGQDLDGNPYTVSATVNDQPPNRWQATADPVQGYACADDSPFGMWKANEADRLAQEEADRTASQLALSQYQSFCENSLPGTYAAAAGRPEAVYYEGLHATWSREYAEWEEATNKWHISQNLKGRRLADYIRSFEIWQHGDCSATPARNSKPDCNSLDYFLGAETRCSGYSPCTSEEDCAGALPSVCGGSVATTFDTPWTEYVAGFAAYKKAQRAWKPEWDAWVWRVRSWYAAYREHKPARESECKRWEALPGSSRRRCAERWEESDDDYEARLHGRTFLVNDDGMYHLGYRTELKRDLDDPDFHISDIVRVQILMDATGVQTTEVGDTTYVSWYAHLSAYVDPDWLMNGQPCRPRYCTGLPDRVGDEPTPEFTAPPERPGYGGWEHAINDEDYGPDLHAPEPGPRPVLDYDWDLSERTFGSILLTWAVGDVGDKQWPLQTSDCGLYAGCAQDVDQPPNELDPDCTSMLAGFPTTRRFGSP